MDIFTQTSKNINNFYTKGLIKWMLVNRPDLNKQIEALQDIESKEAQDQVILLYKFLNQKFKEDEMPIYTYKSVNNIARCGEGIHLAKVEECRLGKTKDNLSDMFTLKLKICKSKDTANIGTIVWDRLVCSPKGMSRVAAATAAMGITSPDCNDDMVELEAEMFIEKHCRVEVIHVKNMQNPEQIDAVIPYSGYLLPLTEETELSAAKKVKEKVKEEDLVLGLEGLDEGNDTELDLGDIPF